MSLAQVDFEWAAKALGADVRAIKAVTSVEAKGSGFDDKGRPIILFEAHKFSKHTGHMYDASHPKISSRAWNKKLYTKDEHARLAEASALNREAALKSASWGMFQILGENFADAGYPDLQSFINAMFKSERSQLEVFVNFVKRNPKMKKALQMLDWARFAELYNGTGFRLNKYDTKLADAFKKAKP